MCLEFTDELRAYLLRYASYRPRIWFKDAHEPPSLPTTLIVWATDRSKGYRGAVKTLIVLIVVFGIGLALLIVRSVRARANRKHDPIEYYRGWGGYRHPITLQNRISREEADAVEARGGAYLIGYFDTDGKLTRVVKMYRGSVFFDFEYAYHPNEKRKSARVKNAKGVVTMREYDESGRGRPGNPLFW